MNEQGESGDQGAGSTGGDACAGPTLCAESFPFEKSEMVDRLRIPQSEVGLLAEVRRIRQLDPQTRAQVLGILRETPHLVTSCWDGIEEALSRPEVVLLGVLDEQGKLKGFALGVVGLEPPLPRQRADALCIALAAGFTATDGRRGDFKQDDGLMYCVWVSKEARRQHLGITLARAMIIALHQEGAHRVVGFAMQRPRQVNGAEIFWDRLFASLLSRCGMCEIGTSAIAFLYAIEVRMAVQGVGRMPEVITGCPIAFRGHVGGGSS